MITSVTSKPVDLSYGNQTFDHSFMNGVAWFHTGTLEYRAPTAQLIVEFIKNNMIDPEFEEWKNDDELLLQHAGFLIGWVLGEYL